MQDVNNKILTEDYLIASPFWSKAILLDENLLNEYFDSAQILPENIKDLAGAIESAQILLSIKNKNKLNDKQINQLAVITMDILSAQIPLNQFIPTISEKLQIPEDQARQIAQEINVRIFSKATLQIKRLQDAKFGDKRNKDKRDKDTNKIQNSLPIGGQANFKSNIHKPEERVVNLHKEEISEYIETGPKIEGNTVDLSS